MRDTVDRTRFGLIAADGYRLVATHFSAPITPHPDTAVGGAPDHGGTDTIRPRIVVAGAAAVPQGFYRRFAEFAARRGFDVLTFDYRGVALSAPRSLRGFDADFVDWGRLDVAAAVDELSESGRHPVHLVGHSFGGQSLGFLPDPTAVRSLYTFGTGAGWHGWMPFPERLRVLALWHLIGPAWTAMAGFLPWSRIGMGEDLPREAFRQWRRWCRHPHYFFDDPAMADTLTGFSTVRTPIVAATAIDDAWAPPRSRDAFMTGYSSAPWQAVDLDPRMYGHEAFGHLGYFRAGSERLWLEVLDRLRLEESRH